MAKKARMGDLKKFDPMPVKDDVKDDNKKEPNEKKPHKCPVCNGKGLLPCGFYNLSSKGILSDELIEQCKTCKGEGIIWSE